MAKWRVYSKKSLNTAKYTHRHHQKKIELLKKKAEFEEPFSRREVVANNNVVYETLWHCIGRAGKWHEADAQG